MTQTNNQSLQVQNEKMMAIDGYGTIAGFEAAQRIATMFSKSNLVPAAYQGNVGSCLIAFNMARRMNADPLQVMQSLYVVHGKPSFSAQFLIACFNQCGRYSAIRYRYEGEKGTDDYTCIATTTELSTGEVIEGVGVSIAMAKAEGWYNKAGSKWKTMPDLMMRYRAATFLIRSTAPEIALGFQTTDEVRDTIDITSQAEVMQPNTLAELAAQAMQQQPQPETEAETPENAPQSPANGTLFEDEVTTPSEE